MKKLGFVLVVILFVSCFFVTSVSSQAPDLPLEDELNKGVRDVKDTAEEVKRFTEKEKWEYLGEQWKEILLKNSFISKVDVGFKKINLLFFLLFGEDYDLSFTFFFSLILWVLFLVVISEVLMLYGTFSENVSWLLAFIFAVIFGHLKIYEGISLILFKLIFFREGIWGWITFGLFLIAYFLILFGFKKFMKKMIEDVKKKKEKKAQEQVKFDREVIHQTAEAVLEGTGAKEAEAWTWFSKLIGRDK